MSKKSQKRIMAEKIDAAFDAFEAEMDRLLDSDIDSPVIIREAQQPQPQTQDAFDLDKFVAEHAEEMNAYILDVKAFNLRNLTRQGGILTKKGSDDFVEKFDLKGLPNGVRKSKIRQLLEENPSLRSTNPQTLWRRIDYFIKKYPHKVQND